MDDELELTDVRQRSSGALRVAAGISHYLPEIFYHDRQPILSLDVHPEVKRDTETVTYKIATVSMQHEVRIWSYTFEVRAAGALDPHFVANLTGHRAAVNVVRFAPNGKLMASGDAEGRLIVWQLRDGDGAVEEEEEPRALLGSTAVSEMPPNRECWRLARQCLHNNDVTALAFSADSRLLASVSVDNSVAVRVALTGHTLWQLSALRNYPNGIAWCPNANLLVTMSTDRKLDVVDAKRGHRLRSIGTAPLPAVRVTLAEREVNVEKKLYKLFHDSQLMAYQRSPAFSPCGQLLIAPAGQIEAGSHESFGSYVFKTSLLDKDTPFAFLPSSRPTHVARCCPRLFTLDSECASNYTQLAYRVLWLVLTKESVLFYDSQHEHTVAVVSRLHYNSLTDAAWSSDGRLVVVSSLEGYCSLLRLDALAWGRTYEIEPCGLAPPTLPSSLSAAATATAAAAVATGAGSLSASRPRKRREKKADEEEEERDKGEKSTTPAKKDSGAAAAPAAKAHAHTPTQTPKVTLLKFFAKVPTPKDVGQKPTAMTTAAAIAGDVITLDEEEDNVRSQPVVIAVEENEKPMKMQEKEEAAVEMKNTEGTAVEPKKKRRIQLEMLPS